jgi:ADP-ribose pyrophosphatase YjhB (NUDIX family)
MTKEYDDTNSLEEQVKIAQLSMLRENLEHRTYPEYPPFRDRYFAHVDDTPRNNESKLIIPDGSWTINSHSNRHDQEAFPIIEVQQELSSKGYLLDASGRPLHPWFKEMVENPGIGIVNGKGAYWKWGPNCTADPIVIYRNRILMVRRKDNGALSLPGGFVDDGEDGLKAGTREAWEETKIVIPSYCIPKHIYEGPVADVRVTANAWAETTAILFVINDDEDLPPPRKSKESTWAGWVRMEELAAEDYVHGSHKFLIDLALQP